MEILFLEDWDKVPGAIVDNKTTNTSFLRMAAVYKNMGIKNHAFLLQLHNRDLQGIDPFDPNLSKSDIMAIAAECKRNLFYFIREVVRTPDSKPDFPVTFKANRGNIALYWLFLNHIMTILIQIRQTGKSLSSDVLVTWLMNLRCYRTQINLLTKDDTLRAANLERLKKLELELPWYLKARAKMDPANTEEIKISALLNHYQGHLPNKSPKMADLVGRGLTSPIFLVDEAAFFANIEISLPAALAAGTAARDMAKLKGDPYGTILTTTAGKKDDRDGKFIYTMVEDAAIWTERFFDCKNLEELEKVIIQTSPKKELMVNCTFNHRQLGKTDEWLAKAIRDARSTGEAASRDFGNVWTSGGQYSPFDVDISERIRNSEIKDNYNEITAPNSYVLRWFIPENQIDHVMNNTHHVIGLDTSDAIGRDDIFMVIRNIKTGAVVAAANINETNLLLFSEWIATILVRFKKTTLVIERRGSGQSVLDYLLLYLPAYGEDPFVRIYNKIVHEKEDTQAFRDRFKEINRPLEYRNPEIYNKYKKMFGFATSGVGQNSRGLLYGTVLANSGKLTCDLVHDSRLIKQILGLTIINGRIDHGEGEHDDGVIAWLLGFWFMTYAKNLTHYGINPKEILSENVVLKQTVTSESKYINYKTQKSKLEIDQLIEELKQEKNQYVAMRLEMRLKLLVNSLPNEVKANYAIDSLIEQLSDQRQTFRR